ncbi:MAG: hypothetical protein IT372_12120 [Polyangiaceae bacterium]|nr:hypothetical protein [Polyangiaceae bacterium]
MRGAWAVGLVMVAACGGSVTQGGGGGGTTGGGGEGGAVPPQCAVEAPEPGPHAVTFQFENSGALPVFLQEDCRLRYEVTSCADGYAAPVSRYGDCTVECSDGPVGGCIACGACPFGAVPVDAGGNTTDSWAGLYYDFGTNADGCACHTEHTAPAGRYRVVVPVYASEAAAMEGTPSYEASVDFELPAPDGVVRVPIGQ